MVVKGLLVGAGLGAIAIVLFRRFKASDAPSSDKCAAVRDLAESTQPGSGAAAYLACRVAKGLSGLGKEKDWTSEDEDNKRLNGEIDVPATSVQWLAMSSALSNGPFLHGSAVRFKNGCVPLDGFPGWERCAPGTHSMKFGGPGWMWMGIGSDGAGAAIAPSPERIFTGLKGDITTGPAGLADLANSGYPGAVDARKAFPLPLAPDENGWFYRGKPFKCKNVRDQRDGAVGLAHAAVPKFDSAGDGMPACGWHASTGPENTPLPVHFDPAKSGAAAAGQGTGTRTNLACDGAKAPAGYTWVEASGATPGHWERLRAGQTTSNPGPCDPNYRPPSTLLTLRTTSLALSSTLAVSNG